MVAVIRNDDYAAFWHIIKSVLKIIAAVKYHKVLIVRHFDLIDYTTSTTACTQGQTRRKD